MRPQPEKPVPVDFDSTVDRVCARWHVTWNDIFSGGTIAPIVRARDEVARVLHDDGWSYSRIARLLGKSHNAISSAVKRATERARWDNP